MTRTNTVWLCKDRRRNDFVIQRYRRNNEQQIDGIWSMSKIVNLTIRDVTVSNEKLLDICNSSEILKKHDEIITIYMHILYSEYN